jgi:VWFA-related protein
MKPGVWIIVASLAAVPIGAQQVTFRSTVEAVQVPVSVTDRNRPVAGLKTADFELLDNNVPQEISVAMVENLPTDVTLLVDTSGSISGAALDRIKVDLQEMANLLQPNDRVRVVSFARDATDVFGVLPGGARLDLDRMRTGGTTSLYDALVSVLTAYPAADRPHFIFVVTDGRDNSSFTSAKDATAVARASSGVLCVMLVESSNPLVREGGRLEAVDPLASEQSTVRIPTAAEANIVTGAPMMAGASTASAISRNAGPYTGGPNIRALTDAAGLTGGFVYRDSSRTPIPRLFQRILDDFRASYVLTYVPSGVERSGAHTITVRTKDKRFAVRARRGYGG